MRAARFGCLTSSGIIAALAAAFVIAGSALAGGGAMYSPGALNAVPGDVVGGVTSHAEIKGDCNACHTAPWEKATMDDRCSTCHTNVAAEMADPVSIHGKMMEIDQGAKCRDCHPEHHGVDALLTVLEKWTFPHEVAKYSLDGHQFKAGKDPFLCSDCHGRDVTQFDTVTCVNCHAPTDITFMVDHIVTFGNSCLNCHDGFDRFGGDFNHDEFTFKLAGKHSAVTCSQCHANSHTVADLQSAKQDCFACHQADDPHKGNLGPDCASCHSPEGWKPSTYDHARSDFKLDGLHSKVECSKCHANNDFKDTPQDCYACHAAKDNHKGQFGTNCGACHNTSGWQNVSYDHKDTNFPLTGLHQNVACKACHVNNVYKNTPTNCYACHAARDNHKGQFGQDCALCHNSSGWKNISFDHAKSAFPLAGTHTAVECKLCHVNGVFKGTPKDCYSCHAAKDNHKGQFGTNCGSCHKPTKWSDVFYDHGSTAFPLVASHITVACKSCHVNGTFKNTPKDCYSCHAAKDNHKGQFGTNCGSCHKPTKWKDVFYNHGATAFPLVGSHATVTCKSCHVNGTFKGTPKDCYSCHAAKDNHKGQFGTNCASCHKPSKWKDVIFDHNATAFPLVSTHKTVACLACHVNGVFKGTRKDCYSCHAAKDKHNGQFGTDCGSCHKPTKWSDVTFDHGVTAFPLIGRHTNVSCVSCHKNGVYKGTPKDCYSCHAPKDKHNGQFGTNCGQCHTPTGWSDVTFNHNQTAFPLIGKHTNVSCASCHKNGVYAGTPKDCYSCHASKDHHNGQFGTDCGQCHTPTGWGNVTFNHNQTAFALTGAHVNASCNQCHVNGVFAGTPKDCYSCHASKDAHGGSYGTNCGQCHSTSAWKPANFNHTFPLKHGGDGTVACATCHPNSTSSYTCYGCHEHDPAKMAEKHKEVSNFSENCAQCHPNGKD
ncbi:MAG: hypothetical protein HZB50_09650 [Chloroflexi bacterium]|nr:hypothetical protein [Chloroflexota bacterium]